MFSSMNKTRLILLDVIAVLMAVSISSCSDDMQQPENPVNPTPANNALRFGIADISSRATHEVGGDWYESKFEDGDKVGSIIYTRDYQQWNNSYGDSRYLATAEWHVKNGILVLDGVWTRDANRPDKLEFNKYNESDLIRRKEPDSENGFLELQKDHIYGFSFYYPFYEPVILTREFDNIIDADSRKNCIIPFSTFFLPGVPESWGSWHVAQNYMKFFNAGLALNEFVQPNIDGNEIKSPTLYKYDSYPMFVNIYQNYGGHTQSGYSNHMWVNCDADPNTGLRISNANTETHHTIDLTFKKKMAFIDVVVDDPGIDGNSIYFRHTQGTGDFIKDRVNMTDGLIVGKKIDLMTGKLSDYEHKIWNGDDGGQSGPSIDGIPDHAFHYTHMSRDDMHPFRFDNKLTGSSIRWRLILPPQDNLKCDIHLKKIDGSDITVHIHDKLTEIKENHLYVIRLQNNHWTITIRDWEDKNQGILIEDPLNQ